MHISIEKNYLLESLQLVSKAISQRTTIPILNGIKLNTNEEELILTASDTEITIQSTLSIYENENKMINIYKKGSIVLPAKFLIEIVRKLPTNQLTIEVSEQFETTITSGSTIIQIMGLDAEEYPPITRIENEDKVIKIPSELLKLFIKETIFSISTNEATPVLTGVLCHVVNQHFSFIACDRHRLSRKKVNIALNNQFDTSQIVIPGRTLNELNKILPDDSSHILMILSDNQILFKLEQKSVVFYSTLISGTYPDTSKLIPMSFQSEMILQTKEFTEAIERAYLLSREDKSNIVKLIMNEDDTIELTSASQKLGKIKEDLQTISMNGEKLKISFNSKYMLDALKVIESDSVLLGFTGSMHPIIIKPENDEDMIQLILPYRTTN
jgi:DNA polymerase-3 subunit beta